MGSNSCRELDPTKHDIQASDFTNTRSDLQATDLHRYNSQIDYTETVLDCCRPQNMCWGTPLRHHRDPLNAQGGIETGVLDVNGDGNLNCGDVHDACFLAYPVKAVHPHHHSGREFYHMQDRNKAFLALEDLSEKARQDYKTFEDDIQKMAQRTGIPLAELRGAAYEIYGDHLTKEFQEMQVRNQALLVLQDLSQQARVDHTVLEEEVTKLAKKSGINAVQLRATAYEIYGDQLKKVKNNQEEPEPENPFKFPQWPSSSFPFDTVSSNQ